MPGLRLDAPLRAAARRRRRPERGRRGLGPPHPHPAARRGHHHRHRPRRGPAGAALPGRRGRCGRSGAVRAGRRRGPDGGERALPVADDGTCGTTGACAVRRGCRWLLGRADPCRSSCWRRVTGAARRAARGRPADLYLDLEGDPFVGEAVCEYLFGLGRSEPRRRVRLPRLLGPQRGRRAPRDSEAVDAIVGARLRAPGLHVYPIRALRRPRR